MERLIESLPAVLRAAENSDEVYSAACVAAWNHTAGDALRSNAVAIRYAQNRLTVAVADPIWQRQLQPMVHQLIYRLNSVLGRPLVRSIEFVVSPELLTQALRQKKPSDGDRPLDEFPPEIISAANNIHDPQLRRAFLGAANSCLARLKRNHNIED